VERIIILKVYMQNDTRVRILASLMIVASLLAGCGDSSDIRSYAIPKEKETSGPTISADSPAVSADRPDWEVPEGWMPGRKSSMRLGSYLVKDGNGSSLDISVSSLKGEGGGLLLNVNRWIGQIGLPPVKETRLDEYVSEITMAGKDAYLVQATNQGQSLATAILTMDGRSWFFKMLGDANLSEREQANFETLLKSVRFDNTQEADEE
ncbi:uncharacterized protein METZ01_LOCUS342361, partial [marine metagenome]